MPINIGIDISSDKIGLLKPFFEMHFIKWRPFSMFFMFNDTHWTFLDKCHNFSRKIPRDPFMATGSRTTRAEWQGTDELWWPADTEASNDCVPARSTSFAVRRTYSAVYRRRPHSDIVLLHTLVCETVFHRISPLLHLSSLVALVLYPICFVSHSLTAQFLNLFLFFTCSVPTQWHCHFGHYNHYFITYK